MIANPYTPGPGFMPAYLAGREIPVESAERYLASIKERYPQQSVIYYGLCGVGKSVLLNRIEMVADNMNILSVHIEANEHSQIRSDKQRSFTAKLLTAINKFLYDISSKEKAREFAKKCTTLLKSFALTYDIQEGSFGLGLDQEIPQSSGNYIDDMTEIMVQLGKAALRSEDTICIFVDDVQYLTEEELGGLISALHRCNQLRLPIMFFCAGLPKILKTAGEAYSYAERLFKYEVIDALSIEDAADAITEPAKDFEVSYTTEAVDRIIEVTGGYPYFIQQFCSVIWQTLSEHSTISINDVRASEKAFFNDLDSGFFSIRYDRCTHVEKMFMTAMVKCDSLPCTISNVAKILNRNVKSVSPIRGKLINKGMIYSTSHGEIDFTVPQFDNFIKRINPQLNLG